METGISRRMVSNAAAKGETVNECQCTMSSWKSQCVGKSMLLADTLLGHRNGCCGPGALIIWSKARRTRQRVRWIVYKINKDGDEE